MIFYVHLLLNKEHLNNHSILTLSLAAALIPVGSPGGCSDTVEYLVWPSSPHPAISTSLDGQPQLMHPTQNETHRKQSLLLIKLKIFSAISINLHLSSFVCQSI